MRNNIPFNSLAALALLCLFSIGLAAQENVPGKLRARDLFLAGKTEAAAPKAGGGGQNVSSVSNRILKGGTGPLGLRYSVLKLGAGGQYSETDPDTVFKSGDRIRLAVESNGTGYLYIMLRGSSGRWTLLFPNKDIMNGTNLIEKGNKYEIPFGTASFQFDNTPGTEKLFLTLSRQPEADMEKMKQTLRQDTAEPIAAKVSPSSPPSSGSVEVVSSLDDAEINKLRGRVASRDLIFEKVNEENIGAKSDKAIYVVNAVAGSDARIVVDLSLVHR